MFIIKVLKKDGSRFATCLVNEEGLAKKVVERFRDNDENDNFDIEMEELLPDNIEDVAMAIANADVPEE